MDKISSYEYWQEHRLFQGFIVTFVLYVIIIMTISYFAPAGKPFPWIILSLPLSIPGVLMGFLLDISIGTELYDNETFVFLVSILTYSIIAGIIWQARLSWRTILILILAIGGVALISSCTLMFIAWAGAMTSG